MRCFLSSSLASQTFQVRFHPAIATQLLQSNLYLSAMKQRVLQHQAQAKCARSACRASRIYKLFRLDFVSRMQ